MKHWRVYLLFISLIALSTLVVYGWRTYRHVQALQSNLHTLEQVTRSSFDEQTITTIGTQLTRIRADLDTVRADVKPILPLSRFLGWIPVYGPDLRAAEPLATVATDTVTAADETTQALAPLIHMLNRQAPLAQFNPSGIEHLERARTAVAHSKAALATISINTLGASRQQQLEQAGTALMLLDAITNVGIAAYQGVPTLAPILTHTGAARTDALVAAQPALERASTALSQAQLALEQLPVDRLPPPLRTQLIQLEAIVPTIQDAIALAQLLPDLLGAQEARTYLLLAQEPYELRATGGFITAAGWLTVDHGAVTDFALRDSRYVDHLAPYRYPPAPEPVHRYMGIPVMVFRDANWSPDFPTTARTAIELYRLGQGHAPKSVIAIEPAALTHLLQATGPVTIDNTSVSSENVLAFLYRQDPRQDRQKQVLARIGESILARIQRGESDPFALARALQQVFDLKQIMVYTPEPAAAAFFARRGWDGAVRPGTHDYLMAVDTTVSYTKSSANIARTISYTVDLTQPEAPSAQVLFRQQHLLPGPDQCSKFAAAPERGYFEDLTQRCNWSYLRILTPHGSALLDGKTNPTPGAWPFFGTDDGAVVQSAGDRGTQSFGTFLIIPMGERRETALHYRLPPTVLVQDGNQWHYRLTIQKQSGTAPTPTTVVIHLPSWATTVASSKPLVRQGQTVLFTFTLTQDTTLELTFQHP